MFIFTHPLEDEKIILTKTLLAIYNRRFLSAQQHSIRRGTAPWATGLAAVIEAALALAARCSCIAVVAMVSVIAWVCLGCSFLAFLFSVLFDKKIPGTVLNKREKPKRAHPVSWASFWLFDQSEGEHLPTYLNLRLCFSLQNAPFEQALNNREKRKRKRAQPVSCASFWLFGLSEVVYLPISPSVVFRFCF